MTDQQISKYLGAFRGQNKYIVHRVLRSILSQKRPDRPNSRNAAAKVGIFDFSAILWLFLDYSLVMNPIFRIKSSAVLKISSSAQEIS